MRYASDDSKRMKRYVVSWRGKVIGEVYLLWADAKRDEPSERIKQRRDKRERR